MRAIIGQVFAVNRVLIGCYRERELDGTLFANILNDRDIAGDVPDFGLTQGLGVLIVAQGSCVIEPSICPVNDGICRGNAEERCVQVRPGINQLRPICVVIVEIRPRIWQDLVVDLPIIGNKGWRTSKLAVLHGLIRGRPKHSNERNEEQSEKRYGKRNT